MWERLRKGIIKKEVEFDLKLGWYIIKNKKKVYIGKSKNVADDYLKQFE